MKTKTLLSAAAVLCLVTIVSAQENLAGRYAGTGYFFHPTSPRAINGINTITKIGVNRYQVDAVGDLPYWHFQFSVDSTNHLVDWLLIPDLPPPAARGFMTSDNPGGFVYTSSEQPGDSPWVHSTYNNTYDPATHTFYMHYGYNNTTVTDENGYDRQIYEKYVLQPPLKISSVSPLNGTSFTKLTIKGENFSDVDVRSHNPPWITIGGQVPDSAVVISDTKITAWVGSGASGKIKVSSYIHGIDSFGNFTYTPVPPVTKPQWNYVGAAGFSQYPGYYVSAACGSDNVPYVMFEDSASNQAVVMKFNGRKWIQVGPNVSNPSGVGYTAIALDKNNTPIAAYVDYDKDRYITVKKFISSSWVTLGMEGFAPAGPSNVDAFSMAVDTMDVPYVLSTSYHGDSLTIYKFNGTKWVTVGPQNFVHCGIGQAAIAIDKISNTPYVVYLDVTNGYPYQAAVMKFNGSNWVTVGSVPFTNGVYGVDFLDIKIDNKGVPIASMQDDDGFQRQSVYQFKHGLWNAIGYKHFSKGRSDNNSIAIDRNNNVFALFDDASYNGQGTVMEFKKQKNLWDTLGARGFLPFLYMMERNCLIFDTTNTPMVAFTDKNHGGRVSLMRLKSLAQLTNIENQVSESQFEKLSNNLSVVPNPAHSQITLMFKSDDETASIEIVNAAGGTVMQKRVPCNSGDNTLSVDISKLSAGSYLITVTTNNTRRATQFLKE